MTIITSYSCALYSQSLSLGIVDRRKCIRSLLRRRRRRRPRAFYVRVYSSNKNARWSSTATNCNSDDGRTVSSFAIKWRYYLSVFQVHESDKVAHDGDAHVATDDICESNLVRYNSVCVEQSIVYR